MCVGARGCVWERLGVFVPMPLECEYMNGWVGAQNGVQHKSSPVSLTYHDQALALWLTSTHLNDTPGVIPTLDLHCPLQNDVHPHARGPIFYDLVPRTKISPLQGVRQRVQVTGRHGTQNVDLVMGG